jgi:hypothetical protein
MKQSINFSQFCDAFARMGRNEQFSYLAKRVLFDYLIKYEGSAGHEIELDVIALCCEYEELSIEEVLDSYYDKAEKKEILELSLSRQKETIQHYLNNKTQFIGWTENGCAVYAQF